MHAKTPVTSVTCGIRGRRFYLALFVFRGIPPAYFLPFIRHDMLQYDIVRRNYSPGFVAKNSRSALETGAKTVQ
jgi:hypothetical protein